MAAAEDARAEVAGGDIVEDAGQEAIPPRDYWKIAIAILQRQSDLLMRGPKIWIGKYAVFNVRHLWKALQLSLRVDCCSAPLL